VGEVARDYSVAAADSQQSLLSKTPGATGGTSFAIAFTANN
jgi:hypothetical protein